MRSRSLAKGGLSGSVGGRRLLRAAIERRGPLRICRLGLSRRAGVFGLGSVRRLCGGQRGRQNFFTRQRRQGLELTEDQRLEFGGPGSLQLGHTCGRLAQFAGIGQPEDAVQEKRDEICDGDALLFRHILLILFHSAMEARSERVRFDLWAPSPSAPLWADHLACGRG